jgi:hypothetical protein
MWSRQGGLLLVVRSMLSIATCACDLVLGIEPWEDVSTSATGGAGQSSSGGATATTADATSASSGCATTICGAACVDLQTDSAHCGVCGRHCFGAACSEGICEPAKLGDTVGSGVFRGVVALDDWIGWARDDGANTNLGLVSKRARAAKERLMFGNVTALFGGGDVMFAATNELYALQASNLALSSLIATRIDDVTSAPLALSATNLALDDTTEDGVIDPGVDKIVIGSTTADSTNRRAVIAVDPFTANQMASPACTFNSSPFRVAVRRGVILIASSNNILGCGGAAYWTLNSTVLDLVIAEDQPLTVMAATSSSIRRKVGAADEETLFSFGGRVPRRIVQRGDELIVLERGGGGDRISTMSWSGAPQAPTLIFTSTGIIDDIAADSEGIYFATVDGVFALGR